jgi:hypothetical protein
MALQEERRIAVHTHFIGTVLEVFVSVKHSDHLVDHLGHRKR